MRFADRIIDLGPGAGTQGGEIVAQGPWKTLAKARRIAHRKDPRQAAQASACAVPAAPPRTRPVGCRVTGANANNLKKLEVKFPAGRFIALCGVSGAGKSTLLHDVIKPAAQYFATRKSKRPKAPVGPWKKLEGFDDLHLRLRGGSGPHRQDLALHARDLYRTDGRNPRTLRPTAAGPSTRLRCLPVFLQQRPGSLPRVPWSGRG